MQAIPTLLASELQGRTMPRAHEIEIIQSPLHLPSWVIEIDLQSGPGL